MMSLKAFADFDRGIGTSIENFPETSRSCSLLSARCRIRSEGDCTIENFISTPAAQSRRCGIWHQNLKEAHELPHSNES